MIYKEKEFISKNGKKLIAKTPNVNDAEQLVDAMISITKDYEKFLLGTPEKFIAFKENISLEEEFIKSRRDGSDYFICVYDNNKIVGDCELRFFDAEKQKHRCEIGITLCKEYVNMGIGSFLFDEMINIAKNTEGIEQIELDVISINERAKHLYIKKGFVKVGDIPHQLKLKDGSYYDGERMVLFL